MAEGADKRKAKSPARPHPSLPLREAKRVAQAITDNNAGHPMNIVLLAQALNLSPTSSGFRERLMASYRYGLTDGSFNSKAITLTALGESVTRPRNEGERMAAEREAFRKVPVFGQMVRHFANSKLPEATFLKNTLVRPPFSVPQSWAAEVAELFLKNAEDVGFLRHISGAVYVVEDAGTTAPESLAVPLEQQDEADIAPANLSRAVDVAVEEPGAARPEARPVPVQFFIAHGRNRKPLEQLQKTLNDFQVPFVTAVDEAHAGRPISEKVADLMRACSAGIFIFTADEEFTDSEGNTVKRPSQNVVYELGAAGLLYGRKIVIFKERGVTFPSDFSDLGRIEFEHDALDAKALDLLKELIALKAVRLVSSTAE